MTTSQQKLSLPTVAEELGVPPYRLRSWENLYPVFHSTRESDGQRYYQSDDIVLIRRISELLYKEDCKSHEVMAALQAEGLVASPERASGDEAVLQEEQERQKALQDEWEKRLSALTEENTQLRRQAETEREAVATAEERLQELQKELSNTVTVLGQENARLQEQVGTEKNAAIERDRLKEEHDALVQKLKEAEAEQQVYQHEKTRLAEVEAENVRLQEDVEQQEKAQHAYKTLQEEHERLTSELEQAKASQTASEDYRKQIESLTAEQSELARKLEESERARSDAQRYVEENENLHSELKKLKTAQEQDEELFLHLAEVEEEKVRLQEKVSLFEKDHAALSEKVEEFEKIRFQYESEQTRSSELETEKTTLQEELERAKRSLEQFESLKKERENAAQAEKGQAEILQGHLDKAESENKQYLEKLEEAVVALQKLERDNEELRQSLNAAQKESGVENDLRKQLEQLEKEKEGLEQKVQQGVSYEGEARQGKEEAARLKNGLRDLLGEVQAIRKVLSF